MLGVRLVVNHYWRANVGPFPEPGAVAVGEAEAAVAAGVAPGTAPVVVVEAGAIAGEVLGEQHVGQVVPAWSKARDADGVAVHCFVGDAPQDREDAGRRWPRASAADDQE